MEGNGAVDYLNPDGSEGELVGASVEERAVAVGTTEAGRMGLVDPGGLAMGEG